MDQMRWKGYLRKDGRKGIRNYVAVVYLCECAHHIATEIANRFKEHPVQLIGSQGCYHSEYAQNILNAVCTHPNVGGVLLISMGCDGVNVRKLEQIVSESGRPVNSISIQKAGGTRMSLSIGVQWVDWCLGIIDGVMKVNMTVEDLIVGTISSGNDATSAMTANPAVGQAVNHLISQKGTVIYAETDEMAGLEGVIDERTTKPELAENLKEYIEKAARDPRVLTYSTIEEECMSLYCQTGDAAICGMIKPAQRPTKPGLFLIDLLFGDQKKAKVPKINVSAKMVDMIASGCHLIICTTGKGSVIGSAIAPVIKICANPMTFIQMRDNIDINAGGILDGDETLEEIGEKIFVGLQFVASGIPSCAEGRGHQEFILH
ncbi:UxaA family hydrolase [Pedobacter sp. MC2016-15]|uniref:UxaA family hydrolase n=1 Tax=Pedobacter sp. MC2016-15 TaxID=2994473 RepID=UPI002246A8F4|nr:UxaA family hydrolase [Pedobacter sp. MC2016-15]MCX2477796.1 UxaA family hydrolase [Pedobacter sp. MC2016-15]